MAQKLFSVQRDHFSFECDKSTRNYYKRKLTINNHLESGSDKIASTKATTSKQNTTQNGYKISFVMVCSVCFDEVSHLCIYTDDGKPLSLAPCRNSLRHSMIVLYFCFRLPIFTLGSNKYLITGQTHHKISVILIILCCWKRRWKRERKICQNWDIVE